MASFLRFSSLSALGLGEAAIPQVRAYYVASLDYGRSTTPGDGLFYPATAQGQRDLVELCRRLSTPISLKPPPCGRWAVITIAVESEEAGIRPRAAELKLPFVWVKGTPEIGRAFGDVSAVPTLLVFDRQGRTAGAYFGAPPNLHAEAETKLASLLR